MSVDDNLFNDQNNDMLDANDEDEEMEDTENNNNEYGEEEEEEEENEEDDENDENNEDDDEEDEDDDDDDEDEDDDDDENEEGDEDEERAKFVDARESNVSGLHEDANKENDHMIVDKSDSTNDEQRQKEADAQDSSKTKSEQDQEDAEEHLSRETIRENSIIKAKESSEFDIIPSVAIPYTSECHALAFTDGPKWILTGGEDGFIRKYDFIASIEGKSPLTMAQRHNMVDSITKAGVISSYWENEQPLTKKQLMETNPKLKISDFSTGSVSYEPKVNPVYSLDVERNGYWCLSGLSSGGISLYTMRYNEGNIHHYFTHSPKKQKATLDNGHNDAVSVLKLNTQQKKFLSGSWDKSIREWDLNTGKCINLFTGSSGQISNIQYRPEGLADFSLSYEDSDIKIVDQDIKPESDIDSLFGDSDNENNEERKNVESQDKPNSSKITTNDSKATNKTFSNDSIFMSSSIDGTINLWDVRVSNTTSSPVLRLGVSDGIPPWCMSSTWSNCGEYIYAGRRNSTVEEFSIKMPHKRSSSGHNKDTMVPNVLKLLQFPKISGPVSAIFTLPNNDFILCGSNDNIRLYNLNLYNDLSNTSSTTNKKPATPFMIIPGHHGGILSALYVDETGRFMVSASGNRGWGHANFTESVLIYEIEFENDN